MNNNATTTTTTTNNNGEPEEKRLKIDTEIETVKESNNEISRESKEEHNGKKEDNEPITKCANHKDEKAVFFCETCKGFRCLRCCCEEEHCKGHRLSTMENGRKVMADSLGAHTKDLEDLIQKLHQDRRRLDDNLDSLDKQRMATQEDITSFASKMHNIISHIEGGLLHSLEAQYAEEDEKLQKQRHKCDECLKALYSLQEENSPLIESNNNNNLNNNNKHRDFETYEKEVGRVTAECKDLISQNNPLVTMHKTFALSLSSTARDIVPAALVRLNTQMHYTAIPTLEKPSLAEVSGTWAKIKWDMPKFMDDHKDMLQKLVYEVDIRQAAPKEAATEIKPITVRIKSHNCTVSNITPDVVYQVRVRAVQGIGGSATVGGWSEPAEMRTKAVVQYGGYWKGGPGYRVSGKNSSVVMKESGRDKWSVTAVGAEALVPDVVNRWTVVLEDSELDHFGMAVGVAPVSISQTKAYNHKSCGWYYTGWSTLYSGPPNNYNNETFGEKMDIHEGTEITLEMDMAEGSLSYYIDSKWIGVAYRNIPTKIPLVPAVVFGSTYYTIKLK